MAIAVKRILINIESSLIKQKYLEMANMTESIIGIRNVGDVIEVDELSFGNFLMKTIRKILFIRVLGRRLVE